MNTKKQRNETVSLMLDGMERDDSLSCGSEFYLGLKDKISNIKVQRERSVRFGYVSLSLLLLVFVLNMVCVVTIAGANSVDNSSRSYSYIYNAAQDSRDVYWFVENDIESDS